MFDFICSSSSSSPEQLYSKHQPVCSAAQRGTVWASGTGVAAELSRCWLLLQQLGFMGAPRACSAPSTETQLVTLYLPRWNLVYFWASQNQRSCLWNDISYKCLESLSSWIQQSSPFSLPTNEVFLIRLMQGKRKVASQVNWRPCPQHRGL